MSYRITYHEEADGTVHLRYHGDAQGLVDACAAEARGQREAPRPISDARANMRKTMSLDPVVMMQIAIERGIPFDDLPAIFKVARDRDYSKFRCVDDARLFRGSGRRIIVGA